MFQLEYTSLSIYSSESTHQETFLESLCSFEKIALIVLLFIETIPLSMCAFLHVKERLTVVPSLERGRREKRPAHRLSRNYMLERSWIEYWENGTRRNCYYQNRVFYHASSVFSLSISQHRLNLSHSADQPHRNQFLHFQIFCPSEPGIHRCLHTKFAHSQYIIN